MISTYLVENIGLEINVLCTLYISILISTYVYNIHRLLLADTDIKKKYFCFYCSIPTRKTGSSLLPLYKSVLRIIFKN